MDGTLTLTLKDPTVTVQKDGEEEPTPLSPKRFAKQYTATYYAFGLGYYAQPGVVGRPWDALFPDHSVWKHGIIVRVGINVPTESTIDSFRATLQKETYKKSKKTGTEKLRCKLRGLDPDLVDDLAAAGPFPCTLEFRTSCDD